MLSTGAFNALLKTLEEPPEHVKFILATTEPQKLPATILSRCQRFDFKRISNDNIKKRLKIVCEESNLEITDEALNIIAILSEGALRDALSILERCIQDGENKIDEDKIKDLVGIPKITFVQSITEAIINYNVDEALQNINDILEEGKDIVNFLWEIIKYLKDILVYKATKRIELYNENEKEKIKEIAEKVSKEKLIELVYKLSELENDIKWSTQKTIIFQAGVIKLCNKQSEINNNIEQRLEKIEKYIKSGKMISKEQNNIQSTYNNNDYIKNVQQDNRIKEQSKINAQENKIQTSIKFSNNSEEYWPQIVNNLKQNGKIVLYTNLINTKAVELNDVTVGIQFPNGMTSFGKTVLEKQDNIREITDLVSKACGKEMQIKYITNIQEVQTQSVEEDLKNIAKESDIQFNIIE